MACRAIRVAARESQNEAAKRCGVSSRLLNDIEHGREDPTIILAPFLAVIRGEYRLET